MRTVRTKVYSFEELNDEAKAVAIEWYKNLDNDFAEWAVDDCALFEPTQTELDFIGFDGEFLIKNTRESIYFDTEQNRFLDCESAMKVTNVDLFLKWLGIEGELAEKTDYEIYTPNGRNNDTTIEFSEGYSCEFNETDFKFLENAKIKFDNHIQDVLKRIETYIDYRFTDESIIDDIEANEYEFLINGKQY